MKARGASLSRRAVVNNDMFPLRAVDGNFNLTDRRSLEGGGGGGSSEPFPEP